MAEARLAVAPTPSLQRAGFEVDTSVKVAQLNVSKAGIVLYIPHPKFLIRNLNRYIWRGWKKLSVAFLPAPLWGVLTFTSAITYWVISSKSNTWQRSGWLATLLWNVDSFINPMAQKLPTSFRVGYLATTIAAGAVYAYAAAQRFVLRKLLSYHGWLSERGKPSKSTLVWGFLLKKIYLSRFYHQTLAYQGSLPTLPLPNLRTTCERHFQTIEPLLEPKERDEVKQLMTDFLQKEGPRLQRWLWLKWLVSTNYVSDWWLSLVYLRCRDSLCINSNWYGVTFAEYIPTTNQAARAAALTYNLTRCKILLDNEKFDPQLVGGTVPLCMAQFQWAFSTTRIPRIEQDELVKAEASESRHIVVIHRGCYYRMPVFKHDSFQQLSPLQLFMAFEGILNSSEHCDDEEGQVPALTSMNRTEWANIRQNSFVADPFNRVHLEVIEKALFVVSLDDEEGPAELNDMCKRLLCGNAINRWSDKSFTLAVFKNGKAGVHAEHSWGDAPALGFIIEYTVLSDEKKEFYAPDGKIKVSDAEAVAWKSGKLPVYPAERMRFQLTEQARVAIRGAVSTYTAAINDLDLHVDRYSRHGKKFVSKIAKMSPDAWIQMAMQLAYLRDQGHFDQTYESSMTRLFLEGRTETIRTVSHKSCAFARAMVEGGASVSKKEKVDLLRAACDQHQAYSHLAMCGSGVDRHLFALYVISAGKNIPSPYLRNVLGRKWKLSTSQVPTKQWPKEMHEPNEDMYHTPNGGFGPVADDGYGVSYCIFGENMFYFNVSSKRSAANTDSKRFHGRICQALDDLAALFADAEKKESA